MIANFKLDDTVRVINGTEYIQAVKPCVGTAIKKVMELTGVIQVAG